jgi:hypothetical protein
MGSLMSRGTAAANATTLTAKRHSDEQRLADEFRDEADDVVFD